jgi:hypothetical protein
MLFWILIYEGVEPIDLATFGVLSIARRISDNGLDGSIAHSWLPIIIILGSNNGHPR